MTEDQDALFVSDEGELRWMPEYAGELEVREAVLTGRPWRWDAAGPHLNPEERSFRKVKLQPPLQEGIRRLLRERDEAREQVRFLMEMVEAVTIRSGGLPWLWDRWYRLRRLLDEQEWFRETLGRVTPKSPPPAGTTGA